MSKRDDNVSLRQMLDHAREAVAFIQNRSRSDLNTDRLLSLALPRLAEVVGEAAARVSPARRKQHADIPWSQIVGLRNRLIHGYDTIDFDILWTILMEDLPALIVDLERIVPPETPQQSA